MLAQATAFSDKVIGKLLLDTVRSDAVAYGAEAVAQGYEEFCFGASEELHAARLTMQRTTVTKSPAPDAEVTALYCSVDDAVNGYKWVYALAGRVVHVR